MAETTGAAETQAVDATQPQAGTGSPSQAEGAQTAQAASAAAEGGTEHSPESISAEEAKKLRSEANSLRRRLAEFERAQAEAEQAKLSEVEKAQRKVAELEQQIADFQVRERDQRVRLAAVETATRLGFRSPDLAYRVLDRTQLEFNDSGEPKNIEKLLKAVLESDPYLGKGATGDFGGGPRGASPSGPPGMNEILRAAARQT